MGIACQQVRTFCVTLSAIALHDTIPRAGGPLMVRLDDDALDALRDGPRAPSVDSDVDCGQLWLERDAPYSIWAKRHRRQAEPATV